MSAIHRAGCVEQGELRWQGERFHNAPLSVLCVSIPVGSPSTYVCLLLTSSLTCWLCPRRCLHGIERAGIRAGDTVLILGAGSNGQMLAMLAPQRGAIRVIVSDPIAYRRQRALEAGADAALDSLEAPFKHCFSIKEAPWAFRMVSQPGEVLKVVILNM
jgi:NADPH:quinone reductase-like Zn-dependent oxidoreductase